MYSYDWKAYAEDAHFRRPYAAYRPVIGITGNFGAKGCELAEGYWRSILQAGGTPMIIPPYEDNDEALLSALQSVDAILLSGGGDLNPLFVGEEPSPALHSITPQRDLAELKLISMAADMQLPILGICRGIQMLTVALGGSVHQDIAEGMPQAKLLKHSQDAPRETATHSVQISEESTLFGITQCTDLPVNSFHHQAVKAPGPHLRVCATSPDGVIEAVESCEHKPILAVQWHPECFILAGSRRMMPLFRWLVDEAGIYHMATGIHRRILSLDSHCDTPMKFHTDEERLTTIPRMVYGHLDASIMVVYLPQGERDEASLQTATKQASDILTELEQYVSGSLGAATLAATPDELYEAKRKGQCAVMRGIENGYAIGRDISNIQKFRQRGVVYMTLCHNGDNDICDSARGSQEHGGLSPFGREVIREMNRTGMMVDLSHASEQSFWDALEISATPIICSHSSCRALTDHPRNLTDRQMKALADKGGVMQVTLYEGFIRIDGEATLQQAIAHIEHAIQVMGIEHVGIGTDFDGDGGVPGVAHAGEVMNLTRELLRRGYTEEQLRLLWGENLLRVMRQCQQTSEQ